MNTPYTYRIYCIPTNQYYYGVRYAKNCHPSDLFVSYFTSSVNVKTLIKEHGINQFVTEIRKVFSDNESAINWESRVTKKVIYWGHYLNANSGKAFNHAKCANGGIIAATRGVGIHAMTSTEKSIAGKKGGTALGNRKKLLGRTTNEIEGNLRGAANAKSRRNSDGWTEKEILRYTNLTARRSSGQWTQKELDGYTELNARRKSGLWTEKETEGFVKVAEHRKKGRWITNGESNKFTIDEIPPEGWNFGFVRRKNTKR